MRILVPKDSELRKAILEEIFSKVDYSESAWIDEIKKFIKELTYGEASG